MKRFLIPAIPFAALATPLVALAASNLTDFFTILVNLINNVLVPLVIAIAVLWFLWGVLKYTISTTDEDKEKGREYMIYGLIGLFVIVSVWGLVNILVGTFDFSDSTVNLPDPVNPRP